MKNLHGQGRALAALRAISIAVVALVVCAGQASAAVSSSSHYGVSEVRFGSGGTLRACSTTYCAKQSAGELAVGNTKSANYQAQAGANTDRQPFLEVTSSGTNVDFGILDATSTKAASSTFSVKNYLSSGYIVTIDGTAPKNTTSGHILDPLADRTLSTPGSEQFGINFRQNTNPAVGADILYVPDGSFSDARLEYDYTVVNYFKYVSGSQVAHSDSSSGQTIYTMSMIANIANNTPGGTYKGRLVINVIPSF